MRWVVNEVRPTLDQHTLTYLMPEEPLFVVGDALRLEQVVQNLLANAIKYSPDGGPIAITIEVEQPSGMICVAVTDRGIGIPRPSFRSCSSCSTALAMRLIGSSAAWALASR